MTKERLRAYRALKYETSQLRGQLEEMESRMYSPKGQQISGMPSGGGKGHTMDDLTAAHIRLREKYLSRIAELEREQAAVEDAIAGLPVTERLVLRARYIEGLSWEQVCVAVGYEWSQTHRIHASALRLLSDAEN